MNESDKDMRTKPSGFKGLPDKEETLILKTYEKMQRHGEDRTGIELLPIHQYVIPVWLSHGPACVKKILWGII